MNTRHWYDITPRRHILCDEAERLAHLLDASRRRAAELEIRRRSHDNTTEVVNEALDELWFALDILNDAVSTLERVG